MDKSNKAALWIIAIAALTWFLEHTSSVLIPFVFSVFLYYIVYPVVNYVNTKTKLGHVASVLLTLLGILVLWTGMGLIVASSVKRVLRSADLYNDRINVFYQTSLVKLQELGFEVDSESLNQGLAKIPVLSWLSNMSGSILTLVGYSSLVIVFLMFMLAGQAPAKNPILDDIQKQITRYTLVKTFLSALTGIGVTIALVSLDVEMAPLFGLLTYLLNFIPNVGFLISILLPVPIVILQHGFGIRLLLAVVIPLAIQFVCGNILETKMMGRSFDLHPVVVMLALVFWGLVWGIVGMLLAVPIMAVLKVIFTRFQSTRFMSELLSGRI